MRILIIVLFTTIVCSCSYKTISFMTRYNYHVKSEDGWINNEFKSDKLLWLNQPDTGFVKLLRTKNDYTVILDKSYIIKKTVLIYRLDSTLKDTVCKNIRFVNSFGKDTTRYVFFTIKAKVKRNEVINYKDFGFRMYFR